MEDGATDLMVDGVDGEMMDATFFKPPSVLVDFLADFPLICDGDDCFMVCNLF